MFLRRAILLILVLSTPALAQEPSTSPVQEFGLRGTEEPRVWNQGTLGAQASRLEAARASVGDVTRFRPRMLEQGRTQPIFVPQNMLEPRTPGCVTVSAISTTNVAFLLAFDEQEADPARRAWPVPSAAGVAEITRCGARKPLLSSLVAKMRSRRGVLEVLLTVSEHPPASAIEALPERNAGAALTSPHVGKRPRLAPLQARVDRQLLRWRQAEVERVRRSVEDAGATGAKSVILHLEAGCHDVRVLGESDNDSPVDLDARLYSLVTDEVIDSDEEHSGQARVVHCVGRGARFRLDFSGARPGSEVTVLQGRWELPAGIPLNWGPHARSQLALSIFGDGFSPIERAPMSSSLGVRGVTSQRVQLDPTACYLVAVASIRGTVQHLAFGAYVGGRPLQSKGALHGSGASLEFCTQGAGEVELETQATGSGLAWILGVWQLGSPRMTQ